MINTVRWNFTQNNM